MTTGAVQRQGMIRPVFSGHTKRAMGTEQARHPETVTDDCIDIIHTIEESLELSTGELVYNRVFIERHFSQCDLCVHGNRHEFLLALILLIFNAITAMNGLSLKVLKIGAAFNAENDSLLITYRTGNGFLGHGAIDWDDRRAPGRATGSDHWLEIVETIVERHGGTVAVHKQTGSGLCAAIELPINVR